MTPTSLPPTAWIRLSAVLGLALLQSACGSGNAAAPPGADTAPPLMHDQRRIDVAETIAAPTWRAAPVSQCGHAIKIADGLRGPPTACLFE